LEHHPAEGETKSVFESDLGQAGYAEDAREHRAGKDTDAIAGNAMHGRSQSLPPLCRDVLFVRAGLRFTAAKNVEERTDHTCVGGDQHKAPF
jgi:hypothetical protein